MEKQSFPKKQTWGTWEKLLLACTVHRFGWDSFKLVRFQRQFHKQLPQRWPETQRIDPGLQISTVTGTEQKISIKYRKYWPGLTVNENIVRDIGNLSLFVQENENANEADTLPLVNSNSIPVLSLEFSFVWLLKKFEGKCLGLEI